jgi:hypothetical protein
MGRYKMSKCSWRILSGLLVVEALSAVGCGGPKLVPVSGTVLVNGRPIGDLRLEFLPDPERGTQGQRSTATTDKEGNFQLLYEPTSKPGAEAGKHRIVVFDLLRHEGIPVGGRKEDVRLKPSRIRMEYANAASTPLKQDVQAGMGPVVLKPATAGQP